jgi:hypothetical protein
MYAYFLHITKEQVIYISLREKDRQFFFDFFIAFFKQFINLL